MSRIAEEHSAWPQRSRSAANSQELQAEMSVSHESRAQEDENHLPGLDEERIRARGPAQPSSLPSSSAEQRRSTSTPGRPAQLSTRPSGGAEQRRRRDDPALPPARAQPDSSSRA